MRIGPAAVAATDIGIINATEDKLMRVAERACRPGEIIHNEPFAVTPQAVVAVLRQLI